MRIFYLILVLTIFNANIAALASDMNEAFNQREKYKNATNLGDPDDAKKFLNKDADVSSFGQLNDSSLVDRGQEALNGSEFGRFLQDSDEKRIEAVNRYKINPDNAMLKNSLEIEKNPMAKTGGNGLSATETSSTIEVRKNCTEGVDFNIDIGLELVLEFEEQEETIRTAETSLIIPYQEVPDHWWQKSYYTYEDSAVVRSGVAHHTLINNEDIHQQIKTIISARVGNLTPDSIFLPMQNIVADYQAPQNMIYAVISDDWLGVSWQDWGLQLANVKFNYSTEETKKKFVEKAEYWQVATEGAEKIAEANECYETARVCIKSGVKTFLDKYEVTRPCWYEKISYRCVSEPKDGCAHLIRQDCRLADSECEYQVGSICLRWKRNFICGGAKKERHYSLADSPIYCLGGDCHTPIIEENQDFANVAYLAALNEAKKDCVKESAGICKNPITVFTGETNGCDKAIVGYINCCSAMKGWGKDINLSRCSPAEQGLALKRDKGLCHDVGTYCHKKDPILGTCLVKKTNFCCFGSKLARIFQEQARKQLPIGWGSASSPNCRPLTIEELTKLDYSKFDMAELFDAMLTKGKGNKNKSFPSLTGGIPEIQKEHMKTTASEKREIKRKAEQLEVERLAKIEAERLEKIRLAKLAEEARLEKRKFINEYQRLSKLAQDNTAPSSTLGKRHAELHKSNRELEKQKGIPYATQICSQAWEEMRLESNIASVTKYIIQNSNNPAARNTHEKIRRNWESELEKLKNN